MMIASNESKLDELLSIHGGMNMNNANLTCQTVKLFMGFLWVNVFVFLNMKRTSSVTP